MAAKAEKSLYLDTTQPETRRRVYEAIRFLDDGIYSIDLTKRRWRVGDGQRGYYWGYLVVEVGKLIDRDRDGTDKVLNALFLSERWQVGDEEITVVRSLSDLDPMGASDYFAQIVDWVWTMYRVRLSEPDPERSKQSRPKTAS